MLWIALGLQLLLLIFLGWEHRRQRHFWQRYNQDVQAASEQAAEHVQGLNDLREGQGAVEDQIRTLTDALTRTLASFENTRAEEAKAREELFTGVFYPTEAQGMTIERALQDAADHAIRSDGQTLFSSTTSRRSGAASTPARSIRAPRRFGWK